MSVATAAEPLPQEFVALSSIDDLRTDAVGDVGQVAPAGPQTVDSGDFYWYFDEQIPLLRQTDRFVIGVDAATDLTATIDALTAESGKLAGYDVAAYLSDGPSF